MRVLCVCAFGGFCNESWHVCVCVCVCVFVCFCVYVRGCAIAIQKGFSPTFFLAMARMASAVYFAGLSALRPEGVAIVMARVVSAAAAAAAAAAAGAVTGSVGTEAWRRSIGVGSAMPRDGVAADGVW